MGGGNFDSSTFFQSVAQRATQNIDDFQYSKTATKVADNLAGSRINSKVFAKLESRDSTEHPNSVAIIVNFDVTGSNAGRAVDAQKALPKLMQLLPKYVEDPQISVAANDDYKVEGKNAFQMSEFESDNRIDDHIRNIWLVGNGGGNGGESYDLILYAAARKTIIDCYEKRGKRGYLFLYADEKFFPQTTKESVMEIFGDSIPTNIPIKELVAEVEQKWDVFILWPLGGYQDARAQQVELFGDDHVVTLEHPNMICETIAAIIGVAEGEDTGKVAVDLTSVGATQFTATAITRSLATLSNKRSVGVYTGGGLSTTEDHGADRL